MPPRDPTFRNRVRAAILEVMAASRTGSDMEGAAGELADMILECCETPQEVADALQLVKDHEAAQKRQVDG